MSSSSPNGVLVAIDSSSASSAAQNHHQHSLRVALAPPSVSHPENNGNHDFSLASAADLIRSIDSAYSEACTSAIDAAKEVEEARRNARAAREIARRFISGEGSPANAQGGMLPGLNGSSNHHHHHHVAPFSPSPSKMSTLNRSSRLRHPRTYHRRDNKDHVGQNGTRRHGSPSSPESKSQSNLDQILSLSLELDRTKHSLESEQMAHDETKSSLAQAKLKNQQLEEQIERLLSSMETEREASGRKVDALQRELEHARMKVSAAEEDAEAALDLARQNTNSRQETEALLADAMQKIDILRSAKGLSTLPSSTRPPRPNDDNGRRGVAPKTVRFADTPTILTKPAGEEARMSTPARMTTSDAGTTPSSSTLSTPQRPSPLRSMVASGRQLLQRSLGTPGSVATASTGSKSISGSSPNASIDSLLESASKRRQRLKDRLKSLSIAVDLPASPPSVPSSVTLSSPGSPSELLEVGSNVINVLRESGKRLNLTGKWWNEEKQQQRHKKETSVHLETLTRHYCTSVEVLIDKKQKEIVELESLCALWEQGNNVGGLDSV